MTPVAAAARAEALADETIELTRALVRANTVNPYSGDPTWGNEANGQAILEPLLRDLGARTTRFDCPPDVYEQAAFSAPRVVILPTDPTCKPRSSLAPAGRGWCSRRTWTPLACPT